MCFLSLLLSVLLLSSFSFPVFSGFSGDVGFGKGVVVTFELARWTLILVLFVLLLLAVSLMFVVLLSVF